MPFKRETPKLKTLYEGEEFPRDFWNYCINSITGFKPEIKQEWKQRKK